MIKRLILIVVFFSMCLYSKAQFSIGLQGGAGVSITKSHYKNTYNNITQSNTGNHPLWFSPVGGLVVNVYFSKRFSLQSEILFENEGFGGSYVKYPLVYIYFPEMIRYEIPVNPISDKSFFIEAGPYFSYCCHYSNRIFINSTGSNNLSRTDVGVVAGLGYKQQWGKGQIEFCVKFEHNFLGQDVSILTNYGLERSTTAFYKILSLTVSYRLPVNTIMKLFHLDKHSKKK